jgi:hypothetical protein
MWMYNPSLFEAATIRRMAGSYELILQRVTSGPVDTGTLHAMLDDFEAMEREATQRDFREAGALKLKQLRRRNQVSV